MTPEFLPFIARLREFIRLGSTIPDGSVRDTDGEFNGLALELFALQFRHNPPYRKLCEARQINPGAVKDWTRIPAVPTSAFKELELSCLSPSDRATVFHSSGTTEQRPSRHFHSAESLAIYEASLWSGFGNCRLPIADCQLTVLTPPPRQAPHSSLVHMFETIRKKLAAPPSVFVGRAAADGSWELDRAAALGTLRQSEAGKAPLVLLGTAFSFMHLLDFLEAENLRLDLPSGSWVMETGGYKGRSRALPKAELHALITDQLGIAASDILCEYGMSELSSQAYDRPHNESRIPNSESRVTSHESRAFHFPPWARVQIISPETGREVGENEIGLLRVFDLANVFSVMAIQTEDLAVRRGDGFELIGRAASSEPRGCSLMAQT